MTLAVVVLAVVVFLLAVSNWVLAWAWLEQAHRSRNLAAINARQADALEAARQRNGRPLVALVEDDSA